MVPMEVTAATEFLAVTVTTAPPTTTETEPAELTASWAVTAVMVGTPVRLEPQVKAGRKSVGDTLRTAMLATTAPQDMVVTLETGATAATAVMVPTVLTGRTESPATTVTEPTAPQEVMAVTGVTEVLGR